MVGIYYCLFFPLLSYCSSVLLQFRFQHSSLQQLCICCWLHCYFHSSCLICLMRSICKAFVGITGWSFPFGMVFYLPFFIACMTCLFIAFLITCLAFIFIFICPFLNMLVPSLLQMVVMYYICQPTGQAHLTNIISFDIDEAARYTSCSWWWSCALHMRSHPVHKVHTPMCSFLMLLLIQLHVGTSLLHMFLFCPSFIGLSIITCCPLSRFIPIEIAKNCIASY